MKKSKTMRGFLALTLAVTMMLNLTPVAHAEETETTRQELSGLADETVAGTEFIPDEAVEEDSEEVFEETDDTAEEDTIALMSEGESDEEEVEQTERNNTISIEAEEENGTIEVDATEASEGEIITIDVAANEGYVLTQVAYRTVAEDGTKGKTIEVTADENEAYTFVMPGSAVEVGAAFQPEGSAVLYNSSNSNPGVIGGSKETDYSIYISNWDVYLNVGDKNAEVYLTFDKRFMGIENISMNLEIRQYNDSGYKYVGSTTYDAAALKELVNNAEDNGSSYVIESIKIPVADGKDYEEGLYQYCVVQFSCPTWEDAFGKDIYRWTYTSVDATVLGADVTAPTPIVWLYNLDENSYRGAMVRKILEELGVKAGTINHENLNQNIGYLVEWEGYEPVENAYSAENYDVEYMLMGNMSDVQLDLLLQAMDEDNIYVALKSIPTAWTASKTFAELFDIMAEESEVLQEAIALDKMIYTAELLDEETYGESEYWDEFQETINKALEALQTDAEETGEGADLYRNARLELERVYLLVTGKTVLEGELELILEELEDGTYKVSAQLNGEIEAPSFTYNWEPASSAEEAEADHIFVNKNDLYKVSLDITGTGDYYGTMSATMYVPNAPDYVVTTAKDSITVELMENETALNTPETLGYIVSLYQGEELVQSQEVTAAKTVVFNNLSEETEYVLKVNAYNLIGRSNIVEVTVVTSEEGEIIVPDGENKDSADEDEDLTTDAGGNNNSAADSEDDKDASSINDNKLTAVESTNSAVKTGDSSLMMVWVFLLMISLFGTAAVLEVRRRER